ncbi:hypothetical protein PCANC_21044 [Puccinia coronata f. sp. avenae]|uniref:Uncharacterized protein n=1 Tax=Puccinia coronata f. sp. avenae TaxID=200324 RepID=A0A2N5UNT7_9BASI|nr:hypothetical protein PCANC_21044 [Puccinia coronata f. sp. avenae]PLW39277.1 hypothetical protein PCASD_05360 [Puccinia coronata f. sp. avenae]
MDLVLRIGQFILFFFWCGDFIGWSSILSHSFPRWRKFGPASNQIGLALPNQDGSGEGPKEIIKSSTITSSQSNPYEELHNLVHLAVAPFFDAYVNSKIKSKNINDTSINTPNNPISGPNASNSIPTGSSAAGNT